MTQETVRQTPRVHATAIGAIAPNGLARHNRVASSSPLLSAVLSLYPSITIATTIQKSRHPFLLPFPLFAKARRHNLTWENSHFPLKADG